MAILRPEPRLLANYTRDALQTADSECPLELADPKSIAERRQFLRESLQDDVEAQKVFERIIDGDELQPASYLERGGIAAKAVARVAIGAAAARSQGYGTGFLIAPGVLITNNHVLPDAGAAAGSLAQFRYEIGLDDTQLPPISYRLDPSVLFFTCQPLDFTVVAVGGADDANAPDLASFGCLPLLEDTGKASEGEWLTIIQHPNGERKQVCVRENKLIKRGPDVLWYTTDTSPGSSGSPVFNNDWFVVALHHMGVELRRDGVIQTVDGRDFDPRTMDESRKKWIANEGIRASRITQTLRAELPEHPLLRPLFDATPASARISRPPPSAQPSAVPAPSSDRQVSDAMTEIRTITIPIQIKLDIEGGRVAAAPTERLAIEAASAPAPSDGAEKAQARFEAPFNARYDDRDGYKDDFLGADALRVWLPEPNAALRKMLARLVEQDDAYVLNYHNYSLAMHTRRRMAIYSAANVDFGHRYAMNRPADVWRFDPRIDQDVQLGNSYYARNNFDRGHLTRREDLEFGATPTAALQSAADTCHWTNCVPQHGRFNQNKEIWQGIERYLLEESIINGHVRAQIITGPVLDPGDPDYRGVQYPLQFWKVVAALTASGKLFATAYIASQEAVIAQYGIEAAEAPFGAYKTFQTRIATIERLTGLRFRCGADGSDLSKHDPLERLPPRRGRRRSAAAESLAADFDIDGFEIGSLDDIILPSDAPETEPEA